MGTNGEILTHREWCIFLGNIGSGTALKPQHRQCRYHDDCCDDEARTLGRTYRRDHA